jgi:hypothetical protein
LWRHIVTANSGYLAAGIRKLQNSGFSWLFLRIFVTASFYITKSVTLWRFCDSQKAVITKTIKQIFKSPSLSGFLWRLMRLAFFDTFCDIFLYFVNFFFVFWDGISQKPSHCDGHKCYHLWRFCDSIKAVTMKTVIERFKSPSLAGFFVAICDLIYFYTSLAYSTHLHEATSLH